MTQPSDDPLRPNADDVEPDPPDAEARFEQARAAWVKFLRAPTDAESDEGGRELDRLFGTEGGK